MAHNLPHSIEDIIRPIKKPPKIRSDHDIFLIQEATKDIPFFAKYIAEGHAEVHLKCCKHITYELFESNQFVFEAGDNGSKFYVILDGKVGVYIKVKTQQKRVKELQRGESFGELALVNDAPRSASIKCLTECHFAVLDKKNYVTLFQQIIDEEVKREVSFYPEIELFRSWNYNKIKSFYTSSFRLKVKKGDRIITEQEHLDAIYIIVSGEFVVKHKTSTKKKNDIQSLRRHSENQILKANNEMSLFIMSKYEIFGQESAQADDPKFEFSVECQSYDGNLIYIKSQDYLRIILSDAAQEAYMSKYSASRLKRVEERIKEVSQTLQFQNDSKPIVVETLVPTINLMQKSGNLTAINNSFNYRGENEKLEESSVSQKNLYSLAPSMTHSRSHIYSNSEIGSFSEIKQNFNSIENKPTIGEMHLLAQRSFAKLEPLHVHSENTPDNSKHPIISDHLLSPSRHHHQNLQLHPLKQKSSIFEIEQQQSPGKNFIPSLSSLDQESPMLKSSSEKPKGIIHLHHSSTSKQQSPMNLSNKHSYNHYNSIEDSFNKELMVSDKIVQFSNELKQDSQIQSQRPQEEKEQQSQDIQHNHIRFSKETSILNSDQESVGQSSPKKWLRINLKIVNKDNPSNNKKFKKSTLGNNIDSVDEEQLHPLVKAFHDQLKIKYYSKFKNGQIEDLKHHLNYQPIQSLHVGKNENGAQRSQEPTIFSSKKIKEKRQKDLREYELKLQSIIKYDHINNTNPIQSISPLDPQQVQKNSNKQGQNIPDLPQLHSSSRSTSGTQKQFNQKSEEVQEKQQQQQLLYSEFQQTDNKNDGQIPQESEYQLYQTENQNNSSFLKQTIKHQRSQSSSLMPKDEQNSIQNTIFFPKGIHVREGRTMFNQNMSNIFSNTKQDFNYFQNQLYNKSPNKSMNNLGIHTQNTSFLHTQQQQQYSQQDLAKSFAYFHQPYKNSNNQIFKGTFPQGSSSASYLNISQQQQQHVRTPNIPSDYTEQSNQTSGLSPPLRKPQLFNKFHSLTSSPSSSSLELVKQNQKNLNYQNKNISREISLEKDHLNIQEGGCSYPHIVESVSQVNLSNNNAMTNSYFHKKRNKFFAIMPVSMENNDTSQKSMILPISNYSKQLKAGFKGSQGFNCSQFNLRKDKATYYSQN